MSKTLQEWVESDVAAVRERPVRWLSENHFFRDPVRSTHVDPDYFLAPADGILLYQKIVRPDECVVQIKGRDFTLRDAMRDPTYDKPSLVVGIFMTFYDVHVNR